MTDKKFSWTSLIGSLLSMEGFLLAMGIASLAYGIANDMTMSIFWGIVIIPGVFALHQIRKKDWAKHWQEMEAEQTAQLEFEARRKKIIEDARKPPDQEK